jgi:hypothetical protein
MASFDYPTLRKEREGWGTRVDRGVRSRLEGEAHSIPHLAKNERDAPNFLYAALDRTACAPFLKERRIKFTEPTKLPRKSGVWGTRRWWPDRAQKARSFHP